MKRHTTDYRIDLIEELYQRYGKNPGIRKFSNNFRFWRKRTAWMFVVGGATLIKRFFDILASLWLMLALIPLFTAVAAAIKLTDGGPVLFWQTRVGKWGKEFRFPKFRSMRVDADREKHALLSQSHHGESITFKMKDDPRITLIGRIIRKFSIDELPQLYNVLREEMSLVGPRPPLPDEVDRYTLKDRRRLDITPGLTCIW